MSKYKYLFQIDGIDVYPIWGSDTSLSYEKPDDQVFARIGIDGKFILTHGKRSDFNRVWANELNHEFTFRMQYIVDGVVEQEINGTFFKTDCSFDEDRKVATIEISTTDDYKKILDAMDKEYDLIKDIAPPPFKLNYTKEPLIQVAFPFHDVLWNKIGHATFPTNIGTTYTGSQLESFGFITYDEPRVFIPGGGSLDPDVSGIYERQAGNDLYWKRLDNVYDIIAFQLGILLIWTIREVATLDAKYNSPTSLDYRLQNTDPFLKNNELLFLKIGDPTVKCYAFPVNPYQRILTDELDILGTPTIEKPIPDIGDLTFNYTRYFDITPSFMPITITPDDLHSPTATDYGKFSDDALHFTGEYHNIDNSPLPLIYAYPVLEQNWREYAISGYVPSVLTIMLNQGNTQDQIQHAYKLEDVISGFLTKINPAITFDSTPAHSSFLFSATNPLTGDMQNYTHFIVPKSNIVIKDYTQAATKEPIKLRDIDELLKNGIRNYWWINDNKFLIEHIEYFRRGKSYTIDNVGMDLTTQTEPKTEKKWAYATKKYKYRKPQMPERIIYSWMDDSPDIFDGDPIEMMSNFVEKSSTLDRRINRFTSDLSYAQAFSENISVDGFMILAAKLVAGEYEVIFTDISLGVGLPDIETQNGYWAFRYLHEKFHKYNLPAPDIKVNRVVTTAESVARGKEQIVVYPSPILPDVMRLLTTSIGNGWIEKLKITLNSRKAEITALHDLDFDNPCPTC